MTKFYHHKRGEGEGDWSVWVAPIQGYKMACCDCGLVHDLQFKVLKVNEKYGQDFNGDELKWGDYRILLRAKRNNRSTGQIRRYKK